MSKLPTSRLPVTPSKTTNVQKSGLRPPQQASTSATTSQQISPAAGDSASNPLSMGERVIANGKAGTVAFIGSTKFAEGEWVGIILDEAQGKNDGSYEGTRYFETEANRGLFCRAAKVQRLVQNGANNGSSSDITTGSSKAQTTPQIDAPKPSTSTTDADTTLVNTTVTDTNNQTVVAAEPPVESSSSAALQELRVGDRVVVSGTKFGVLKYLGKIHVAEGTWCGIQLDDPLGKNDGSVSGKRYFTCQQRYGLFSPLARVEKVTDEMSQSQIIARKESITSTSTNTKSQLHRSTSQESLHSNLSEFSTSSNSISRIPTRTPGKAQQQKLATNSNIYTTPNTKSLLTQAAATLAAVTPSSNQMNTLVQTLKEKDIVIQKLQTQCEQDRLEFSRAAQQVDEMENRMLSFKQQYDAKESENEQLKKDQYQTQQRIEDLEFQLEEYKLTDSHKEHQTTPSIPDGHRLLSPKDIEIYEEIKEKVLEFETINQKLVLEKQTLQDEHKQELKRQGDLTENDYQSRLNELEQKHKDELKSKETDQQSQKEIDQLKSQITDFQNKEQTQSDYQTKFEQSTKETEEIRSQLAILQQEKETKEQQTNELLTELKRYQENLLPDLEKQYQTLKAELTDLQNRDRTANLALSERESQYEEQVKEYQINLNQAVEDSTKIRNELKQIQEENLSKENQLNDLINTLKQDHEKLQTELNQREEKTNSTKTEYEQQIKDYQTKIEQTQSELNQSQEEKTTNEKKSNEMINSLKRDYEKLQTELTELQDKDRTQNMALNERESHYESQIKEYQVKRDQTLQEIEQLRNELTKLQEEKSTSEKELSNTINSSREDFEKQVQSFKSQITELENQNQQIKDYQAKFEQIQSELTKIQEEKDSNEKTSTETINSLKQDYEKLQTELTELQEKDRTQNMTVNERESQIKEYQVKHDQTLQEIEHFRNELIKSQEEKSTIEKDLNNTINSLKEDFEKQIQSFKTQITELENQNQTKSTDSDQQIKDYEHKLTQLHQQIEENNQKTSQLQKEFNDQTEQNEHLNTMKKDFGDLQTKYTDLQTECQKHLSANEQLKNTTDNILNEKQALIDQLTKQINDMQQVQTELIEKQINQHTNSEQEQKAQENQIQLLKVEIENLNLAHEQEKLRLKETFKDTSTTSNGNVKQMEYELTEAKYQIENLQKQIEMNGEKDDRSTLESQINFLNDVIVELRNTNEDLKKEIEFLKNPFIGDEEFAQSTATKVKSSAPRLYCDMCEVFDQHDTDDCPKQSSLIDEQPLIDHQRVLPPPRLYCEKCEEFDHDCNEIDETY